MKSDKKITKRALKKAIDNYFDACDGSASSPLCASCKDGAGDKCSSCIKKRTPYTLSGLCQSIGVAKRRFLSLRSDDGLRGIVEDALMKIERYVEENSLCGTVNATFAQAILKENFGWGREEAPDSVRIELSREAEEYGG